jgi:hypothetical protein
VHADLTERYLRLGLGIDRHVDGMVDAYFGPAELAEEVRAAPPLPPAELAAEAQALLDELDDGWLRDQVSGLRVYAGVLAGESLPFADEAEGCYGVRPVHTDEEVFAEAHRTLDQLLPGTGSVAERHERWRRSALVPEARLEEVLRAVIEVAREATRTLVDLPAGEGVQVEVVHDVPWMGFCEYLGDGQSRISVNADLPTSAIELLILALHETYPGHHTERCCKDAALVRGRGLVEESIVLVPTPQSLIAEGIAVLAPRLLLEGDAGPALAAVLDDAGVELDLPHALAVDRAAEPCRWAEVNGALLLYEDGAAEADVQAYLERWGLMSAEIAAHVVRFYRDPTSRTYIVTYPKGRELCRAYVGGDLARYRRLLTEQVRVGELRRASDSG